MAKFEVTVTSFYFKRVVLEVEAYNEDEAWYKAEGNELETGVLIDSLLDEAPYETDREDDITVEELA